MKRDPLHAALLIRGIEGMGIVDATLAEVELTESELQTEPE
jgi:hypothetical protein